MKVSLVIPVFNNATTVIKQLQQCKALMNRLCQTYEMIISNDKSTDTTKKQLEKFAHDPHVRIIHQTKNLGIARNIFFLYQQAKFPYILLFSIDGDWNTQDIELLIKQAEKTKADIVIGKRNIKDYPLKRKVISFLYNLLPYLLFGVKTYDTGSIKLFKKELLEFISLRPTSMSFESEMIIRAVKKKYILSTIPVSYKRENKKTGVHVGLIVTSFFDLLLLRLKGK
jgi:dolichol-phosphate mannosyltransferase